MIWRFWEPEHVKLLRKSKARIKDPKQWCQRSYMRDTVTGETFAADAKRLQDPTMQFCAQGSLLANAGLRYDIAPRRDRDTTGYGQARDALHTAAQDMRAPFYDGYGVVDVNDHLGHDAVMDMYNRAIKIAKKS